tara:strand:+ start:8729 stop:11998 length:3270 start_codon:yes stop_codon:yes gene_type:complete
MASEFSGLIEDRDQQSLEESTKSVQQSLAVPFVANQQEPEDMPVLDLMGRVAEEDFAMANAFRALNREVFDLDPDFVRTPDMYKDAMKTHGVLPENLEELDDAVSLDDWNATIQHIKEEQDLTTDLAQYGWKGAGIRLAVNMADPAMWGLALMTGGLGLAGKAAQMSRLAYVSRVAGFTAAETALLEGAIMSDKVTWGWEDSLAAVGTAGILGAGAGAISGRILDPVTRISDDAAKKSILQTAEQAGIKLSDDAKAKLAPETLGDLETAPTAIAGTIRTPSIGQADNRIGIRYDMMSRVKTSLSPVLSKYFSRLAQDVLPDVGRADDVGGAVNKISATELATRIHRENRSVFSTIVVQRNKFAKAEGLPGYNIKRKNEVYHSFYELVERAVRRDGDSFIDTELQGLIPEQRAALKAARDAYRESTRKILQELKDAGIDAADDIDFNKFYVPRRIKYTKLNEWVRDLGEDKLIDTIAEAYLRGTKGPLTRAEARTLAKSYVLGIRRIADDNIINFGRISARNIDELERYLKGKDIDTKVISDTRAILEKKQKAGSNLSARGQRVSKEGFEFRADIDELYETTLKNNKGETVTFRMEDLFESNVMLYDQYLQTMSGRISAAKVLGIKSDKDYQNRVDEINQDIATLSDKDQISARSDLDRVEIMYRHLMGKSLRKSEADQHTYNFATRLILAYNYTLYMGQVGFAQLAEIGNIAAFFGLRAMFKQIPSFKAMKRDLETGQILPDQRGGQILRELEAITGIGSEFHRFSTQVERYTGTAGEILGGQFTPGQQKVLNISERFKQATSIISGMTPVTIWMQRLSAKAAVQNMYDKALRGFDNKDYQHFRELGLDKQTADALGDQLKRATTNERGVVQSVGLDDWDPQLREDFANALSRLTYRVIQENDVGAMSMFMTSNIGKLATQFRTFMLVAHAKQSLQLAHKRDLQTFNAFMATAFMGGLAYMAQTGIKGITADDLHGEDGKWTLENIAKSAFQRSAYSALIPAMVDTGLHAVGFDPLFAYGRSTGLATGIIDGSPAYQTFSRLQSLLGLPGAINPISDNEVNWEKLAKSIPLSNAVGIHNLIQALFDDDD